MICRILLLPLVTNFVRAAQLDRALTGRVDLAQLFLGVDDLTAGRKVGTLDRIVGDQLVVFDLGITQQFQQCVADFLQVVRRDVGRHARPRCRSLH